MKRIVVHVQRLALRGVRAAERGALVAALRAELSRQLAGPGSAQSLERAGDRVRLRLPPVRVPPRARPAELGTAVARGLARGIKS